MEYSHKITRNGHLRVELNFTPQDLERMESLFRAMLSETGRALKLAASLDADRLREYDDADAVRIDCAKRERRALAALDETGDIQQAAQASGLQVGHVRMVEADAITSRREKAVARRNKSIVKAVAGGASRAEIANRWGLHVATVGRIVRQGTQGENITPAQGIR